MKNSFLLINRNSTNSRLDFVLILCGLVDFNQYFYQNAEKYGYWKKMTSCLDIRYYDFFEFFAMSSILHF